MSQSTLLYMYVRLLLLAALLLGALTLTLGVDLGSEGAEKSVSLFLEPWMAKRTYSSHFRANQYSTKT